MQLLDLKTVKQEKSKGVKEQIDRVEKLHIAETGAVKSLNETQEFVESEKKRLNDDLIRHTDEVNTKKAELTELVVALEKRRTSALKPIKAQKKEAEERIELATQKEEEIKNKEISLSNREDKILERLESITSTEDELDQQKEDLDKREEGVKKSEESNKESTEKLNKAWAKFHEDTNYANKYYARRKQLLDDQEKTVKTIRESNTTESLRLVQERRLIHDTYIAIEQAKKHLNIIL